MISLQKMAPQVGTRRKQGTRRHLINIYGNVPYAEIQKRRALEVSNNKKCWWIYQFIMNWAPFVKRVDNREI